MELNSKKIRVLYLSQTGDLEPDGRSSLLSQLKLLDKERFEAGVVVSEPGSLSRNLFREQIQVFDCSWPAFSPFKPVPFIHSYRRLHSIVQQFKPAIIHCDTYWNTHLASLTGNDAKIVMKLSTLSADSITDRLIGYETDALLSPSQAIASRFAEKHEKRKLRIIPNGIDTDVYKPASNEAKAERRKASGLPVDKILVGLSADFSPSKRHDFIITLWPEVVKRCPNAFLLLAGDGETSEVRRVGYRVSSEGLTDSVNLLPRIVDRAEFLPLLDLSIQPSSEEGFANVILESGACGLPTIGSSVPGINEAIIPGQTGELAPPANSEVWIEKLVQLINDREFRIKLGSQARTHVEQVYSITHYVKQIEAFYEELLKRA